MAIAYEIDHDASLIRVRLSDPLSGEEIVETVDALLAAPDLSPGLAILSDHALLQATASSELVKSVMPLLERLAERLGRFKCALVVPADGSYGMARMAEVFAEGTPAEVRAFRTVVEAKAWLSQEGLNGRTHH
jgi:hypothetical protein